MKEKFNPNDKSTENHKNTFKIIPVPPRLSMELTASFTHICSERHAIELGIEKWELIYEQCCQGVLLDDGSISTCALCHLYFDDECEHCPITLAGYPECMGTPYWDYQAALEVNNLPLAKEAAAEEIEFLEGLIHDE